MDKTEDGHAQVEIRMHHLQVSASAFPFLSSPIILLCIALLLPFLFLSPCLPRTNMFLLPSNMPLLHPFS